LPAGYGPVTDSCAQSEVHNRRYGEVMNQEVVLQLTASP